VITRDPNQQRIFREKLIKESEDETGLAAACAVSGCKITEAIEAAHILGTYEKGYAISTGVLLRRDLHTLFDRHAWSVGEDGKVVLGKEMKNDPSYKDVDTQIHRKLYESKKVAFEEHFKKYNLKG
jgi:predicted restriction endonuclease